MTTISAAQTFFTAYADQQRAEPTVDVRLVVVADQKTPAAFYEACSQAQSDGLVVVAPPPDEQQELLDRLQAPTLVPWNSDNRRNIGYLLSLSSDADFLVSVDDDNFPMTEQFFADHSVVLPGTRQHLVAEPVTGWWDPCDQLEVTAHPCHARGFPYAQRRQRDAPIPVVADVAVVGDADVRVNAGLWIGEPDVDAITRIGLQPQSLALTTEEIVLGPRTWAPINSQNTAVESSAVPAYYFPRMGSTIGGFRIDRFADIFSGYFVQACAKHLGHSVRFGSPTALHVRNDHRLLADLSQELPAILVLDELLDWLVGTSLEGSDYPSTYLSLTHLLDEAVQSMPDWSAEVRGFFHEMSALMRIWLRAAGRAGLDRP